MTMTMMMEMILREWLGREGGGVVGEPHSNSEEEQTELMADQIQIALDQLSF